MLLTGIQPVLSCISVQAPYLAGFFEASESSICARANGGSNATSSGNSIPAAGCYRQRRISRGLLRIPDHRNLHGRFQSVQNSRQSTTAQVTGRAVYHCPTDYSRQFTIRHHFRLSDWADYYRPAHLYLHLPWPSFINSESSITSLF